MWTVFVGRTHNYVDFDLQWLIYLLWEEQELKCDRMSVITFVLTHTAKLRSTFRSEPSSISIRIVCEKRRLLRVCTYTHTLAQALAPHWCDSYRNLDHLPIEHSSQSFLSPGVDPEGGGVSGLPSL